MLDLKARPMREHDYTTLFKLEHMLKDVRLCLEEGQALGVPFPFAALTREILSAGMGRGLGDADFAAADRGARIGRRHPPVLAPHAAFLHFSAFAAVPAVSQATVVAASGIAAAGTVTRF